MARKSPTDPSAPRLQSSSSEPLWRQAAVTFSNSDARDVARVGETGRPVQGLLVRNHAPGSTGLPPLRISKYSSGWLRPPLSPAAATGSPDDTRSPTAL